MQQESKYNEEEVLQKLKHKGLKAKYNLNGKLNWIEARSNTEIGLKFWAYLDFLGVPLIRK